MSKKILATITKCVLWYELTALVSALIASLTLYWQLFNKWEYTELANNSLGIVPTPDEYMLEFWAGFRNLSLDLLIPVAIVALVAALVHAYVKLRKKD